MNLGQLADAYDCNALLITPDSILDREVSVPLSELVAVAQAAKELKQAAWDGDKERAKAWRQSLFARVAALEAKLGETE